MASWEAVLVEKDSIKKEKDSGSGQKSGQKPHWRYLEKAVFPLLAGILIPFSLLSTAIKLTELGAKHLGYNLKPTLRGSLIVTGGLGYIGSHSVVEILKQPDLCGFSRIVVIDDLSNS
jgi:hypothetical protein